MKDDNFKSTDKFLAKTILKNSHAGKEVLMFISPQGS
jgi:hypothetical protein